MILFTGKGLLICLKLLTWMRNPRHFYIYVHFSVCSTESNCSYSCGCHFTTKGKSEKQADLIHLTDVRDELFLSYLLHNSCILKQKIWFNLQNFWMHTLSCCQVFIKTGPTKKAATSIWNHKWIDYQWNMKGQSPITLGKNI